MITKFNKYNRYYRAVDTDLGKTVEFEPLDFYEAIDKDGNPIWKYDTFWTSNIPEVATSKTVGGAVMGLFSMFMQHGKKPDTFYIYEITEEPDVDISHWSYGDFEFLDEVRYRRNIKGKYIGKIKITDDIIKRFLAYYEMINLEPYDEPDEETYKIYQDTDYEKLISSMGKRLTESRFNKFVNESMNNFELKYGKWMGEGYSKGYPSWILYDNKKPVAAISNDSKDKNNVIIRHIEAFEKGNGYGLKLIFMLLDNGVTLETGIPNYNSISSSAYKMNKKIVELIKNSNGKYKSTILGKANNKGKEDEEKYKDVIGVEDNYHYRWEK
jgi:hypothetical protein